MTDLVRRGGEAGCDSGPVVRRVQESAARGTGPEKQSDIVPIADIPEQRLSCFANEAIDAILYFGVVLSCVRPPEPIANEGVGVEVKLELFIVIEARQDYGAPL